MNNPKIISPAIKIFNIFIGPKYPCFLIAEAGVNHKIGKLDLKRLGVKSSLEAALLMVDEAKKAGVDAIKFQSFTADTLQFKGAQKPQYQVDNVGTDTKVSYYDLIKSLETSREDQIAIAKYCKEIGILFFSTPYDPQSADFLKDVLHVPLYKLASIDLHNHLFIRYIAKTGIPFILSTGLSNAADVQTVVSMARREGFVKRMILLQCTSNYPTAPSDIHLNVLKTYLREFPELIIGLSDHSPTDIASIAAVAIGAKALEKHFTLDKSFEGPDHSSSLSPSELSQWVKNIRETEASLGSYEKKLTQAEKRNLSMLKYLVLTAQPKGTLLQSSMFKTMRTGGGVLPVDANLKKILGKKLKRDISQLTPFDWNMI